MKNNTSTIYNGVNTKAGDLLLNRLLPNPVVQAVGAFVLLDHVYPVRLSIENEATELGETAHPHRGMVAVSYVLSGDLAHYDSIGNRSVIKTEGLHWMKAGKGILHEEKPLTSELQSNLFHSIQFWISLPANVKTEEAEYQCVQAEDVPELELPAYAGKIRILLGDFGCSAALLKTFNKEFIYHIKLNPKSNFILPLKSGQACAAFVPSGEVMIDGKFVSNSELIVLEDKTINLVLSNSNIFLVDIFIFGSDAYLQPIVSEGPFVMNTKAEIAEAYRDFFDQKYGQIEYH